MIRSIFTNLVDEMILMAKHDPELADGLKYVNQKAFNENKSTYEIIHEILYKTDSSHNRYVC